MAGRKLGVAPKLDDFERKSPPVNDWLYTVGKHVKDSLCLFRGYSTLDQTGLVTSTWTKITLTDSYDPKGWFSSSTWTPQVAGYYRVSGAIILIGNTATSWFGAFYKNGSHFSYMSGIQQAATSVSQVVSGSDIIYLNGETDYLEMYGYITAASGMQASAGSYLTANLITEA